MNSRIDARRRAASLLLEEVAVVSVRRTSPSFVRVVLGGGGLADLGVDGPLLDQRIKLVFPAAGQPLPRLGAGEDWYQRWLEIPDDRRGQMRTYTLRDVLGTGRETRLVVDLVVHGDPPEGAGGGWAGRAVVGDRLLVVAPLRGVELGGREFAPAPDGELLLVGDESAVPAIAGILRDLPASARGVALVEVPVVEDIALLAAPPGVDVRWLPRAGTRVGTRLVPAVRRHLGLGEVPGCVPVPLGAGEDDVWETPLHPAAGADLEVRAPSDGRYAWIAGESTVVRTLRRTLVDELGWDRRDVCFMGYWRIGVAMRS